MHSLIAAQPTTQSISDTLLIHQEQVEQYGPLFEVICSDILEKGYSVLPNALPTKLGNLLLEYLNTLTSDSFSTAGIGREDLHMLNQFVRKDSIKWIDQSHYAGAFWLGFTDLLRQNLNQNLFLNLDRFESHFAHYRPGDFYKQHLDAFKGQANRVLSMVTYLNQDWNPDDGGELVIALNGNGNGKGKHTIQVTPSFGTIVLFLSEEFPHEVLPAKRDRYSIAGWFRLKDQKLL